MGLSRHSERSNTLHRAATLLEDRPSNGGPSPTRPLSGTRSPVASSALVGPTLPARERHSAPRVASLRLRSPLFSRVILRWSDLRVRCFSGSRRPYRLTETVRVRQRGSRRRRKRVQMPHTAEPPRSRCTLRADEIIPARPIRRVCVALHWLLRSARANGLGRARSGRGRRDDGQPSARRGR